MNQKMARALALAKKALAVADEEERRRDVQTWEPDRVGGTI